MGSTFSAAAQRVFNESFDPSTFLNDQIYGNLRSIHPKYLRAKRDRVNEAFTKLVVAVTWLLKAGASDEELISYQQTRDRATVLADWRKLIAQSPHVWPAHPIFAYILALRESSLTVDKATACALSNALPDRFAAWEESEKVLLPSGDLPYVFRGLDLRAAYRYAKDIYDQSAIVVAEFCTPPYGWQVQIAANTQKLLANAGFAPQGLGDTIRQWAKKEIYKQYLSKLGIIEHTLDFGKLIPGLASESSIGTAKSVMEEMLARRDVASKVFGAPAVQDMANLLGELKEKESAFDPSAGAPAVEETTSPLPTTAELRAPTRESESLPPIGERGIPQVPATPVPSPGSGSPESGSPSLDAAPAP